MFQKFFKKPSVFDKFIKNCSLFKSNYVMKNEDVDSLISLFTDQNSKNMEIFFDQLNDPKLYVYTVRMKILITLHLIVQHFQIGATFSQQLLQSKLGIFEKTDQKITNSTNADIWLLEQIQLPFLQYLRRIALNVEQFQTYRKFNFTQRSNNENMIDCFRLQNISIMGLSLVPLFKTALTNFPHDFLLKKLATQLYQEMCNFLKQLITILNAMIESDGHYQKVEIYEFYRDTFQIEKKVQSFYAFSKMFDPGRKLLAPQLLKINNNTIYQLEQAAVDERKQVSMRYISPNADTLSRKKNFGMYNFRQETILEEQENYTEQKQQ